MLEKFSSSVNIGDVVDVKGGYFRNYLLPRGKVLRYSKENQEIFDEQREKIESENKKRIEEAKRIFDIIDGAVLDMHKSASNDSKLYGSVVAHEVVDTVYESKSVKIDPKFVNFREKIKEIGRFAITITLHPDVVANLELNVCKE